MADDDGPVVYTAEDTDKWRLTPEAVVDLARDIVTNRVYLSTGQEGVDLQLIFMPLAFMGMEPDAAENIGAIYEYIDKAGPRAINGLPMFFSCRFVHADDMEALRTEVTRMSDALGIKTGD